MSIRGWFDEISETAGFSFQLFIQVLMGSIPRKPSKII